MSKHIILKAFICSVIGVSTGFYLMHSLSKYNSTRQLASSESPFLISKLSIDQVSRNYFQLKLSTDTLAEKQNETSVVVASITALQDLPANLKFTWILGKDTTATSNTEGLLPALKAGDTQQIQISVQNFSHEIQNHVSLNIEGNIGEHKVSRNVIISSRPEDSFEYVVQQAALQRKSEPDNMKIQKLSNGQKINDKFNLDKIIR
jgi:aspartokinase